MRESTGWRSLQERLEQTRAGHLVISAFIVATLFSVITMNLYPSDLKRQFLRVAKPYVYVTGVDQGWDVFSPNPRRDTVALVAQIHYVDGSVDTWTIPRGGSLFGAYWDYRWRKWVELLVEGFAPKEVWKPAAEWIARTQADPHKMATEVELVSRVSKLASPGVKPTHTGFFTNIFYTLRLENGGSSP
jgi:hypothetical protein